MKIYFMQKSNDISGIVKKKTSKMKEMNSNYSFFKLNMTDMPSKGAKQSKKASPGSDPKTGVSVYR